MQAQPGWQTLRNQKDTVRTDSHAQDSREWAGRAGSHSRGSTDIGTLGTPEYCSVPQRLDRVGASNIQQASSRVQWSQAA